MKSIFHEIDAEQPFNTAFKTLSSIIEPFVVHVRSGSSSNEVRKQIVESLQNEGFANLDINSLLRDEIERKT